MAPPRVPLAVLLPGTDGIALLGSAVLVRGLGRPAGAYALFAFLTLMWTGAQRPRINPRLTDDFASLVGRLALPVLAVVPFAVGDAELGRFLRTVPLAVAFVVLSRAVAYKAIREARARGYIAEATVILGAGQLGVQMAATLRQHHEFGLVPIGFLDSFDDVGLPLPILGQVHELEAIVREFNVKRVIVAFGGMREPDMVPVIRACDRLSVEVHVIPRFFELGIAPLGQETDDLWGIPIIRLRRSALRTAGWRTKRIFDLIVGSVLLVLSAPLFTAAAIAVRVSSPGPIFFRQKRMGQRGDVFKLLKFRSMRVNTESDVQWNVSDDQRLTRVGRILRKTSLDELPQLINVLRGEMSLVGPRPERPFYVDRFRVAVPRYEDRHRVPAGITGWAQVHGLRGDTSIPERARFDNFYVEHWSLWRDVVILARTVMSVLKGSGG